MSDKKDSQYFLIIKKNNIEFKVFNQIGGASSIKEMAIENYSMDINFNLLEEFLEKNIFEIEKKLQNFIKKIYIIFESDSFFEVGSSIKHNLRGLNFNHNQLNDALIDIKYQLKKHSQNYEIIHMVIIKYIINGAVHKILPENIDGDNLVTQVNFISLDHEDVENLNKLFSKYQISITKILCYDYLKRLNNFSSKNIVKIAHDSIYGQNVNEVLILKKTFKKQGFFEKFFNFFN